MRSTRVDVAIIGGGAAGSAAALQLARMRRSVLAIDAGSPRNQTAEAMHSFPSRDGMAPGEYLELAWADAERFGARRVHDSVERVTGSRDQGFSLTLSSGAQVSARAVMIATGVSDELPAIAGVRERWGRDVLHCPYCHGYEVSGQRIVVIDTSGNGSHQALLFSGLSPHVSLVVHEGPGPNEVAAEQLELADVEVIHTPVERLEVSDDRVRAVLLTNGQRLDADAVVVGPGWSLNLAPFDGLNVEANDHPMGLGQVISVDEFGQTSVAGCYAVGNVVDPSQQVLQAAANGSRTAAFINMSLRLDDIDRLRISAANRDEWERRYSDPEGIRWSGSPNGTLVKEVADMTIDRALDIGCGEGADAIWLAQQGAQVTAVEVSATALERAQAAALDAGVVVEFRLVDPLVTPPEPKTFDLVSIQYPALARSAGADAIKAIFDATAEGGTLLIVGHHLDLDAMDEHHRSEFGRFLLPAELETLVGDDFDIVVSETRPRPHAPQGAHHVDDVVVRAVRHKS